MARPLRVDVEGGAYHVTSRGNNRQSIFRSRGDRLLFLSLLGQTVKRFRWLLHEWTLMTTHFHLVIETPVCTLSEGMHWLNGEYARLFNKRHKRTGHLYERRFDAKLIENENYLQEVRRYTVLNPVRAGMVAHPADYEWSSYRAHAGLEPIPDWLYSDWLFELDPDPARCHEVYRDHIAEKIGSTERLWDQLVGQIYLGSAAWIEKMRKVVESKPRSDEYPQAQRLIPRLKMARVVKAVAEVCDIDEEDLRHQHGGIARMLAAWIGWNDGLLRLREIAAALRLRSAGYISTLIRAADEQLTDDALMRDLLCSATAVLR